MVKPIDADWRNIRSIDLDHEAIRLSQHIERRNKIYKNWPKDQPIPETMRVSDHIDSIKQTIKNIQETTACYSCPKRLKCRYRNWRKSSEFTKVIGCSGHPDQGKYPGHSTNVQVYDLTSSGQLMLTNGTWSSCRSATDAGSFTTDAIGPAQTSTGYYIARGAHVYDLDDIPAGADFTDCALFGYEAWYNGSTTGYTHYNASHPASSPVYADYDQTYNSGTDYGTFNTSSGIGSWKHYHFSDLSFLVGNAINTFYTRDWTRDENNSTPTANVGENWEGPTNTGGHDPYLDITYDDPVSSIIGRRSGQVDTSYRNRIGGRQVA